MHAATLSPSPTLAAALLLPAVHELPCSYEHFLSIRDAAKPVTMDLEPMDCKIGDYIQFWIWQDTGRPQLIQRRITDLTGYDPITVTVQ